MVTTGRPHNDPEQNIAGRASDGAHEAAAGGSAGNEGRLTLGNKALRRRWWGRGTDKSHREEGRGSKRSAKSEAEEEGDNITRVRLFQPPSKRARNLIAGH